MKYLMKLKFFTESKKYIKSPKFEVGDAVVAINTIYSRSSNTVIGGATYVVLSVSETAPWKIQIRQLRSLNLVPISNSNFWDAWFDENNFNLLHKYPFIQNLRKFNI